ncbi:MAG: RHS repeat protein [Chitinophagaceae bacterium]|nr:RHS repeat protein [Chitinophagaceae bacterium]
MKFLSLIVLGFISFQATAQYYYNDIIGTTETNRLMKNYRANKVKMVTTVGIDQYGAKNDTYGEVQEVRENGTVLKTSTRNNTQVSVYYNRFDAQGRLISITDSSAGLINVITYQYDAEDRIKLIQNTTADAANDFNQIESHHWTYDATGNPLKMWRTINNADSLEIRFIPDENGLPGDEKTFRRGIETGAVYYYYDENKRLTDVVRYNLKLKKLLPDMMFEYDEQNRVIQKITTTPSLKVSYLIWRYIYDNKGLKTKEALFNDDKQLTGKIEYSYTFNQ